VPSLGVVVVVGGCIGCSLGLLLVVEDVVVDAVVVVGIVVVAVELVVAVVVVVGPCWDDPDNHLYLHHGHHVGLNCCDVGCILGQT